MQRKHNIGEEPVFTLRQTGLLRLSNLILSGHLVHVQWLIKVELITKHSYKLFPFSLKVPPIDSSSTDGIVLDDNSFKGDVAFENIEFVYPSRPDIKVHYTVCNQVVVFHLKVKPKL